MNAPFIPGTIYHPKWDLLRAEVSVVKRRYKSKGLPSVVKAKTKKAS